MELRKLQLGCHVGGYWFGAACYADDLILLAPSRDVLQKMLHVCETYAKEHNLMFSTDPVPAKSKSKCLYFCGRKGRRVTYPAPLILNGKELPWVESADHLGHRLHQLCNMDADSQRARGKFISSTIEVREKLSFARPEHIMNAIQIYCTDAYGSMLWDLGNTTSEQYFKSWNTCVKMVYEVPRNTFTYLIEGWFTSCMPSLRNQVISRYPKFYRQLTESRSKEIRFLVQIVSNDPRSTTYRNLKLLRERTNLRQAEYYSRRRILISLPTERVPDTDTWRVRLLASCLKMRTEIENRVQDTEKICAMISSLCST